MYPAIALCLSARKGFWDGVERKCFFNIYMYIYILYKKPGGLDFISLTPPSPPQWTKQRRHNSLCQVLQCRGTESVKGSIEICSPAVRPSHSPLGPERTSEREREKCSGGDGPHKRTPELPEHHKPVQPAPSTSIQIA